MKNVKLSLLLIILISFCHSSIFAQQVNSKQIDDKSQSIKKADETTATGDKIIFKDGTISILEIENEGNTGSIMFPNAGAITPSGSANKLYNNNGNLYWGTNQLGLAGGGVSAINDLSDAKYDGYSLYLGEGSGANDNGNNNVNTAVGKQSLYSNTEGYSNTANGFASLYSNTTGSANTANGREALYSNTTGYYNTASGYFALYANTTGNDNTASGFAALRSNITGDDNTASGYFALYANTTGNRNTASGYFALYANTTGNDNTASGYAALKSNTTGNDNTATGFEAINKNQTGANNTANGYQALYSNLVGSGNVAFGYQAGYNETGSNKLYIENSNSSDPLIYGDFTDGSEMVKINGDLYSVGRDFGGNFLSNSTNGVGVKGIATATGNPTNYGGYFTSASDFGRAVYGEASATDYILGVNFGGYFTTAGYEGIGVYGSATKTGADINNIGGKFEASGDLGIGIHATAPSTGWAGYFDGNASISNKVFIGAIPQTPSASLHIKQTTGNSAIRMEYISDTDYWDTDIDGADDYNFRYNGSLKSYINDTDGAYIVNSDERLKNNITEVTSVLPAVLALKPKRYYYNDDKSNQEQIGLIAQDVEKLFPETVSEKDGYKGINYAVFGVLAIEAIKEQQSLIEKLTKRIEELESRK